MKMKLKMSNLWKEILIPQDDIKECKSCSAKIIQMETKNGRAYEAEVYHNEKGLVVVEINNRAKEHNCYYETTKVNR